LIKVTDKQGQPIPADVMVNSVLVGKSPQRVAIEKGKSYQVDVSYSGYVPQKKVCDDSQSEVIFELEHLPVNQTWLQKLIEWLINLFKRK
jgi:hypothetical protein